MVDRYTPAARGLEALEPRQLLSAGDLDPSFGQRGAAVLTQFGTGSAVDVRDDGKIVIATGTHLLRLNPNGSLDRSFGDDGSVTTGLEGTDTAFMPDGRIVVAGRRPTTPGNSEPRIARYTPDGRLDTSFNGSGFANLPAEFNFFSDIAVQNDGRIIVGKEGLLAEEPLAPPSPHVLLARFDADDGALDTSFGDNGLARGAFGTVFGGRGPSDIFILRSGEIHVVGSSSRKGGGTEAVSDSFDSNGKHLGSPYYRSFDSHFHTGVERGDGSVVTLGHIEVSSHDYLPGQPPAFASVNGQEKPLDFNPAGGDIGTPTAAVAVPDSNDQIYVAGAESRAMSVTRLNGDGSPDESFGHGGTAFLAPRKSWQRMNAYALDVAPGGDVILVGDISRKGGRHALAVLRVQGGADEPAERTPLAALVPVRFEYPGGYIQPTPGQPRFEFSVQYAADDQIDTSTLGDADVIVIGPGGYRQRAKFEGASDVIPTHRQINATYSIPAPGGSWDRADNGRYRVLVRRRNIFDTAGQALPSGQVGAFRVKLSNAAASLSRAMPTQPQESILTAKSNKRDHDIFLC